MHVLKDGVPKQTVVVRSGNKPWFDDRCVLAHRAMQRAYRVWRIVGRRLIGRYIGWLVVMLSKCMWKLNKQLMGEAGHSWRMHLVHGSGSLP